MCVDFDFALSFITSHTTRKHNRETLNRVKRGKMEINDCNKNENSQSRHSGLTFSRNFFFACFSDRFSHHSEEKKLCVSSAAREFSATLSAFVEKAQRGRKEEKRRVFSNTQHSGEGERTRIK